MKGNAGIVSNICPLGQKKKKKIDVPFQVDRISKKLGHSIRKLLFLKLHFKRTPSFFYEIHLYCLTVYQAKQMCYR